MQSSGLGLPLGYGQTENLGAPDSAINNHFQDIDGFLESVLVQNPVSIDAELVPSILSRGLGLNCDSSSLGQQGSNDRRVNSGKPWSSVSNDAQGATGNNNNNTTNAIHKVGIAGDMHVSDKAKAVLRKRDRDETTGTPSTMNACGEQNDTEDKDPLQQGRLHHGAGEKCKGPRDGPHVQKLDDMTRGTSKKRVHIHKNKVQKQMQWNKDLQQQLTRQQMQQQLQQMQQQQMQQQLQQMQQQYSTAGTNPPFGLMPPPGYLFPSQQQQFPPIPYPFQVTTPDGRRVGIYPGMDQQTTNNSAEEHATKRSRLVWTDTLHQRFLEAVDRCGGIEQALPKAIMKDMKVDGLTRENVSSHLQKYRLRLRRSAEERDQDDIHDDYDANLPEHKTNELEDTT